VEVHAPTHVFYKPYYLYDSELRLLTGMIRAAHTPVFRLLGGGGNFEVFAPQGRHVALMGVKFGLMESTEEILSLSL